MSQLREKVRGAWAGKVVGVAYGGPTEFRSLGIIVPTDGLPAWKPDMVRDALKQDDLYVQMTYAEVLDANGLKAKTADFSEMLKRSEYPLWHTSQAARRALRRGVPPMEVATPEHSVHGQDISFQIIADFIGLSCPGMPKAATELADRVARVAAWGDGQCAGRFVAGMYTAAYFETDAEKIIEAGLASIPPESDYAKAVRDVIQLHRENPTDWQATWKTFTQKWDNQDRCPYGALAPLNIDAKLNAGYTAIGLLYGGDDFAKTLEISTRCGQDSDCNPCTACGVWGAAYGYSKIPAQFTAGIDAMADEKFIFTESTFNSAVDNTIKRAAMITQANGGEADADELRIKPQTVTPSAVRTFPDFGNPIERVKILDPRWTWTGKWEDHNTTKTGKEKVASEKGAAVVIRFTGTGTGAILCGPYVGTGGQADVYLDSKFDRTIDVYPDLDRRVVMEDVWHKFNLDDKEHTLKLVVKGENFGASTGAEIRIHSLIVYK